jgi:hypothetical protein
VVRVGKVRLVRVPQKWVVVGNKGRDKVWVFLGSGELELG